MDLLKRAKRPIVTKVTFPATQSMGGSNRQRFAQWWRSVLGLRQHKTPHSGRWRWGVDSELGSQRHKRQRTSWKSEPRFYTDSIKEKRGELKLGEEDELPDVRILNKRCTSGVVQSQTYRWHPCHHTKYCAKGMGYHRKSTQSWHHG